jgi:hypothetical protein
VAWLSTKSILEEDDEFSCSRETAARRRIQQLSAVMEPDGRDEDEDETL